MPLGIGHFGVGVFIAAVSLGITGLHLRIDHDGYVLIASGLFAIVPDLGQVFPYTGQTDQYALANLFWLHRAFDRHAFFDSLEGTAVLSALTVVSIGYLAVAKQRHNTQDVPVVDWS